MPESLLFWVCGVGVCTCACFETFDRKELDNSVESWLHSPTMKFDPRFMVSSIIFVNPSKLCFNFVEGIYLLFYLIVQ